jgi:4-alpha-glucanotransferase
MQPVHLVLGIHVHQPVGNFDHVFAQHVEDVYLPFLAALTERDAFPIGLHVSGPLIEWLHAHDRRYLDAIGRLAADGKVELLLAGCYEPILATLPRADRVEQIEWLRALLRETFGSAGTTLWLTERVWEPDLPGDLVAAGVDAVLVDDHHFLVNGFEQHQLHAPFRTESDGRGMWVLPIHERLRYLVPFRPPAETASYLHTLRERGHRLAVLADDGEKFGGWPGTKEWVYDRGWLRDFLDMLDDLRRNGVVVLTTPAQATRAVPSAGLAYLPTASYREMEGWALWPEAARRLRRLETEFGIERMEGPDGALVRGTHWRNFLARYPESNRMHKKMLHLSRMARDRGNPPVARRAIGRAQCNDAYWHGVFGGLYLPHIRAAVWRDLATAERELRRTEDLAWEAIDFDEDGAVELWIHSGRFSAIVSPARGGGIEEYSNFEMGVNHADVLSRRLEAYHEVAIPSHEPVESAGDTASIHDLERGLTLVDLPPLDAEPRALFVERIYSAQTDRGALESGFARGLVSWATRRCTWEVAAMDTGLRVSLRPEHDPDTLEKVYEFGLRGLTRVSFRWSPPNAPDAWFTTELSHHGDLSGSGAPEPDVWTYPIETVAKSERGLERTRQGTAVVFRWPASLGRASVTLTP